MELKTEMPPASIEEMMQVVRMNFTGEIILKVWQKAEIDQYNVPNDFRKDQCGTWIERTQYGNS